MKKRLITSIDKEYADIITKLAKINKRSVSQQIAYMLEEKLRDNQNEYDYLLDETLKNN